jgi:hypothetical protein
MKRILLSVLVVIVCASVSSALPRFALKKGDINCMSCHLDPTGGGLRIAGGEGFEVRGMPSWKVGDSVDFSGQLTPSIRLGADFRSQFLGFDQIQPFYTGDSSSGISSRDTSTTIKGFHAMSYALEMGFQATQSLAGYLRYDLNGQTPVQSFAILHYVHESGELLAANSTVNDAYIKFGAFQPAFGIRFDDHTLYVRNGTASLSGFDRAGFFWAPGFRDIGAELGAYFFDHLSLQVGIYNGSEDAIYRTYINPQNTNLAFTGRLNIAGEIIEDKLAGEIGASIYQHPTDPGNDISVMGIHGGVDVGPVSLLAEYDNGKNIMGVDSKSTSIALEAAIQLFKGFAPVLRYETFRNEDKTGVPTIDVKNRLTVGYQWFPIRFLEIRHEFRIATVAVPYSGPASPSAPATEDHTQEMGIVQLHFFF